MLPIKRLLVSNNLLSPPYKNRAPIELEIKRESVIISNQGDIYLVFGIGIGFAVLLLGGQGFGYGFMVAAVIFSIFVDLPHVLHTTVRLISDKDEWVRFGGIWSLSLLATFGACVLLVATDNELWIAVVWVYWQPLHVFKQNFGIVKIYGALAKSETLISPLLYSLFFGCLSPMLFRINQSGFVFGTYEVFGHPLPFTGLEIPTADIPLALVAISYSLFFVSVIFTLRTFFSLEQRIRRCSYLMLLTVASFCAMYNLSYVFVEDLYALILIATSIHAAQYHLIVCSYQKRKAMRLLTHHNSNDRRSYLNAYLTSKHLFLLFMCLVLTSLIILSFEFVWSGIIPVAIVLHHFFMDGLIWKSSGRK